MTINKEQAVSDAVEELVARSIGPMRAALADGYDDETALRTAFEWAGVDALLSASHPLEQQQAVSGDARDALDYALGHITDDVKKVDFLECWREDKAGEWPGYLRWLAVQREGAAKAKARTALQEEGVEK